MSFDTDGSYLISDNEQQGRKSFEYETSFDEGSSYARDSSFDERGSSFRSRGKSRASSRRSMRSRLESVRSVRPEYTEDKKLVLLVLEDLVYWENPPISLLTITVITLIYILCEFSGYSMVSLFCYLILLQLGMSSAAMKFSPVLKEAGVLGQGFRPKKFVASRQAFTSEDVLTASRGIGTIMGDLTERWEYLVTEDPDPVSLVMALATLSALSASGLVLTLSTGVYLMTMLFFIIPPLYERNADIIDDLYDTVYAGIEAITG